MTFGQKSFWGTGQVPTNSRHRLRQRVRRAQMRRRERAVATTLFNGKNRSKCRSGREATATEASETFVGRVHFDSSP
jgi:hypothetical protein